MSKNNITKSEIYHSLNSNRKSILGDTWCISKDYGFCKKDNDFDNKVIIWYDTETDEWSKVTMYVEYLTAILPNRYYFILQKTTEIQQLIGNNGQKKCYFIFKDSFEEITVTKFDNNNPFKYELNHIPFKTLVEEEYRWSHNPFIKYQLANKFIPSTK